MMMLLVLSSEAQNSTDNPLLPRIYEDGYSIEQIKDFALQSTEYSSNYRRVLLKIVNNALRESGEYINVNGGQPLTSSHISWIYDHVERDPNGYLPVGYRNTFKSGNSVVSIKSKKEYYGPIDMFIFRTCVLNIDKPSCINLLGDLGIFEAPNISQQDPTMPLVQQRTHQESESESETNAGFIAPKTASEMMLGKVPEEQNTNDIVLPKYNWNWKPVIIIAGTAVTIGAGLLVYSLLKKGKPNDPIGGPVDPTDPMDPTGP